MGEERKRILLLSSNPLNTDRLRLEEEQKRIKEGLKASTGRDNFIIEFSGAVTIQDMRRKMLNFAPHIVQFSGHGAGQEGLVFEDENGMHQLVSTDSLRNFFGLFKDILECVVLNTCYSQIQAEEISKEINYVIGMDGTITDKAAIDFSVAFYDAIYAGKSYEYAYQLACAELKMESENVQPQIFKKDDQFKDNREESFMEDTVVRRQEEVDVDLFSFLYTHAGWELPSDLDDARVQLEEIWKTGNSESKGIAANAIGDICYNHQDYNESVKWYARAVFKEKFEENNTASFLNNPPKGGNMWGYYNLGWAFYCGNGVHEDMSVAKKYFAKAAQAGNSYGSWMVKAMKNAKNFED